MRRIPVRVLVAVSVISTLIGSASAPAFAQPVNEDFDDAAVIAAIPFSDAVDTTEATSAADDPEPSCVPTSHTVWYGFTPTEDVRLEANTFGSDYDTTVSVWTGERGSLEEMACNDDTFDSLESRVRFDAAAGTTYHFMVGSFADSDGGDLVFNLQVAPPQIVTGLTIDPEGKFNLRAETATITGTVTCSAEQSVFLDVFLEQRVGRFRVFGFGFGEITCSGETPWTVTVFGESGAFSGGRAIANVAVFSEDDDPLFATADVGLRGGG